MLINDQLYVIDRPESVIEPLSRGDIDHFLQLARWGKSVGTDMTSVLLTHPEINEVELLHALSVPFMMSLALR